MDTNNNTWDARLESDAVQFTMCIAVLTTTSTSNYCCDDGDDTTVIQMAGAPYFFPYPPRLSSSSYRKGSACGGDTAVVSCKVILKDPVAGVLGGVVGIAGDVTGDRVAAAGFGGGVAIGWSTACRGESMSEATLRLALTCDPGAL